LELKYDNAKDRFEGDYNFNKEGIYQINYELIDGAGDVFNEEVTMQVGDSSKSIEVGNENQLILNKGWNLVSLDNNLSDLKDIKIIWQYNNQKWSAYSPIEITQKVINETKSVDTIASLNIKQGTWIYSNKIQSLATTSNIKSNSSIYPKGWSLNGTNQNISVSNLECLENGTISTVWKYKNLEWLLSTKINNDLNLESFNNIEKNEGFWVNCK
jgi:hypothetical protein